MVLIASDGDSVEFGVGVPPFLLFGGRRSAHRKETDEHSKNRDQSAHWFYGVAGFNGALKS